MIDNIHSFDINVAMEVGVECAVVYQNLCFWVKKSIINDAHYHDGYHWTYNTAKAFERVYPYFRARKVARLLDKLVDAGLVIKGNYNSNHFDRTCWYACPRYEQECLEWENKKNPDPGEDLEAKERGEANRKDVISSANKKSNTKKASDDLEIEQIIAEIPNAEIRDTFAMYVENRKKIKSPMTANAVRMALKKLNRMANSDAEKIQIIENSVANGWKGLFELKPEDKRNLGTQRYTEEELAFINRGAIVV